MIERRGRPSLSTLEDQPRKFTRVYEDEDTIETWIFNLDKFARGPIETEIKYKAGAEKRIKEAKQIKKTERQMNKINKRNNK